MICPGCKAELDITESSYIHRGNRYWHEECMKIRHPNEEYEVLPPQEKKEKNKTAKSKETKPIKLPREPKANLKKCYYCDQYFDIDKEEFRKPVTNRYAHVKCYEENHTEDDEFIEKIYAFLSSQLINYDFLQCEKQRMSFIQKNGYTNEGILLALKYFYLVKKQSADRSGNRIGIVPYVYDEAQVYYTELEKRKKKINRDLKNQLKKETKHIKIKVEEKKDNKKFINLDSIKGSD